MPPSSAKKQRPRSHRSTHCVVSAMARWAPGQTTPLRGRGQGTVRIVAVASVAIMVLPAVLARVLTRWPNLHVQILEAVEHVLTVALTTTAIDVVISGVIPESDEIVQ